ncbi:MAG: T9SS type A sorting domain-containing protein [Sphingobacteriales bacterium]|nr:MAG: T9SS type A sorting domain-containing protein [Sphingobacteriales bacterium]
MKKLILMGLAIFGIGIAAFAQNPVWQPSAQTGSVNYPTFGFKLASIRLKSVLSAAGNTHLSESVLELPNPDGKTVSFKVWKNTLIPAELQVNFPDVWTFTGTRTDNPAVTIKLEYSPRGLYAMVYDAANTYFIDPVAAGADEYKAYLKTDAPIDPLNQAACQVAADIDNSGAPGDRIKIAGFTLGNVKRTYRLALSCTGEYAEAVAGANPATAAVFAAMVTTMNRVNGIYERELAVTMQFIANNNLLIYTNPNTDPFTANNNGDQLLGQNQNNTNSVIGVANYDLGHIFSTGAGGVAMLGSVCRSGMKAMGVTGRPNPVGDPFDVDYVAHEMGHQFGADHSFNKCSGTENASTAYEPGSGSTIMGYAGICGAANDLQNNSNDYFHKTSLAEINARLDGGNVGTCATTQAGYTPPMFTVSTSSYQIPLQTPFELDFPQVTSTAINSALLTNIEQYDRGDYRSDEGQGGSFTEGPSFRSFAPGEENYRSFPRYATLRNGSLSTKGERVTNVARDYAMAYNAREIHTDGWGAINSGDVLTSITAVGSTGPFRILYPSENDSVIRNSVTKIYWDVANSDIAPVNCSTVDIYLSTDGGITFPLVLAQNVPNTGNADVTIPDLAINNARVKIKATDNIFFSFSKRNVVIGNTASTYNPNPTSLPGVAKENPINIYPNPVLDVLNIELNTLKAQEGSLVLVNTVGQVVWKGNINPQNATLKINTTNLAQGIYILKYKNNAGQDFYRKVSVMK